MSAVRHFFQFGNMSRIGSQKIAVPNGVQVAFQNGTLTVKGPKGELSRKVRDVGFHLSYKRRTLNRRTDIDATLIGIRVLPFNPTYSKLGAEFLRQVASTHVATRKGILPPARERKGAKKNSKPRTEKSQSVNCG
jgi:hypothetical protein